MLLIFLCHHLCLHRTHSTSPSILHQCHLIFMDTQVVSTIMLWKYEHTSALLWHPTFTLQPWSHWNMGIWPVPHHSLPSPLATTCNAHWKCLPDLGVEVFVKDQRLSWYDATRPDSTRMYNSDTRYNDTWSPYRWSQRQGLLAVNDKRWDEKGERNWKENDGWSSELKKTKMGNLVVYTNTHIQFTSWL